MYQCCRHMLPRLVFCTVESPHAVVRANADPAPCGSSKDMFEGMIEGHGYVRIRVRGGHERKRRYASREWFCKTIVLCVSWKSNQRIVRYTDSKKKYQRREPTFICARRKFLKSSSTRRPPSPLGRPWAPGQGDSRVA